MAKKRSKSTGTPPAPAQREAPPASAVASNAPDVEGALSPERILLALHAAWQIESIANAITEFAKDKLGVEERGHLQALSMRVKALNGVVMSAVGDCIYDTVPLDPLRRIVDGRPRVDPEALEEEAAHG